MDDLELIVILVERLFVFYFLDWRKLDCFGLLLLRLVDDLGLGGGPLVVGRHWLVVEGSDGLLGVSALLRGLGSGHKNGLEIKKVDNNLERFLS